MGTKAVFTMKLEPDLRDSFMAETAAADRPASQVVRELMRDYIEQRRHERAYSEYLGRKAVRPALLDAGRPGTQQPRGCGS